MRARFRSATRWATIVLEALLTSGCAFVHGGVPVLLPIDSAVISRDTSGIPHATFLVVFAPLPETIEHPPSTAASIGYAILAPASPPSGVWRLERVVGLIGTQSSGRPVLPQKFNAPPEHVPIEAYYRRVDGSVAISVDMIGPG